MASRPALDTAALLPFSRGLRRIDGYEALIELVRAEVQARLGLTNAWLYVFEHEHDDQCVLVAAAGPKAETIRAELPVAPAAGDWLVEALRRDEGPIVIPDAQLGDNPEIARRLQNRTVINMPIGVVDHALGILGCGTFGDEGVIDVDEAALAYLMQLANITSVAVARLVLRRRDAARAELEVQLAKRQRLESLGLLAGGVAHDFNNLLTVVRVSVDFLRKSGLSSTQEEELSLIAEAERSASALTRKLLLLGRQDAPALQSTDLNQLLRELLRVLARVMPAQIQIDFVGGVGLPSISVDPRQIEQVVMNLALNARDAMPEGGRLTIETEQVVVNGDYRRAHPWAKPGRYLLLSVSDTGCGMPAEVMERVFEPFFTTKGPGQGSGLGLAIAWGIVQEHGGMIHCYSELGLGSSFKIYLPTGEQPASRVGTKIAGPVPGGSERVLVADDQPDVLEIMARVLAKAGYAVHRVANGLEALEAASREPFDLYVLDAVMPGLSGREACERIGALQPGARFVFTSGYGGEALPGEFLRHVGVEVIAKPFDPDGLLRAVRAALDA